MTTLTVYFASSPTSSSSSSPSSSPSITTTNPSMNMNQTPTKPIPIPTSTSTSPSATVPTVTSPKQKTPARRTSSKRNKTFFERFDQTSSSTLNSTSQSPPNQTQQPSMDSSNPSIDAPPRLRRRFTFRRSFRHSVHNKGGEIDDGIRSVSFVNFPFLSIFVLRAIRMIDDFLSSNTVWQRASCRTNFVDLYIS